MSNTPQETVTALDQQITTVEAMLGSNQVPEEQTLRSLYAQMYEQLLGGKNVAPFALRLHQIGDALDSNGSSPEIIDQSEIDALLDLAEGRVDALKTTTDIEVVHELKRLFLHIDNRLCGLILFTKPTQSSSFSEECVLRLERAQHILLSILQTVEENHMADLPSTKEAQNAQYFEGWMQTFRDRNHKFGIVAAGGASALKTLLEQEWKKVA